METCIVRQPILNQDQKVVAYELLYPQDGSTLYNQMDYRVANTIQNFFMELDQSNFLGDKDTFLTFTPNLLMKNVPRIFSEKRLVIQIDDNIIIHPLAQKIIYRYKKQGYRLALNKFEFSPRHLGIIDVIDVIKIDFSNPDDPSISNIVNVAHSFKKKIVAYKVDSQRALEKAEELGCDYVQGTSVAELATTSVRRMQHLPSNFFQLIVAITKDEPDLEEVARLIEQDVTLAYALIKMVNSAYFALRNKVKSIKQALTVLGLGQLKQWVYLLSFQGEEGDVSEELIRISFLRGNFCQSLSESIENCPVSRSEAYLLGMFSTLGVLMQVPLEDAIKDLPISDELRDGLTGGEGFCGTLLQVVLSYEKADWRTMRKAAEKLNLPVDLVSQKYLDSAEYVNTIWTELMSAFDETSEENSNQTIQTHPIETEE